MSRNQYHPVVYLYRSLRQLDEIDLLKRIFQIRQVIYHTLAIKVVVGNKGTIIPETKVLVFPVKVPLATRSNHVEWVTAKF